MCCAAFICATERDRTNHTTLFLMKKILLNNMVHMVASKAPWIHGSGQGSIVHLVAETVILVAAKVEVE